MVSATDTTNRLNEIFGKAGATGFIHVVDIDSDAEVGLNSDEPVVLASVFKIAVLLEMLKQGGDATEAINVPASRRTMGPTGLSPMLDDATLSLRDLAFLMMSISDNTATDVIMERIGLDNINATLKELGLNETVIVADCDGLLTSMIREAGLDAETIRGAVDPAIFATTRSLDPRSTNRSTPREIAQLLKMIWLDQAATPEACAEVRRIMALQAWGHRLTSGFEDGVTIAAKTGTLPSIRNEAGVVQYPDGRRFAVAVFTKANHYRWRAPAIDASIGDAARTAIDHLRSAI